MDALLHGHCHHKAIIRGAEPERKLLEQMQLKVRVLTDGCCGMAGGFGFEADKYDISVKIGEHALLPAVRNARPTELIVADGFSCREQISQLTDRRALHTAEVLQLALHQELQTCRRRCARGEVGPGTRARSAPLEGGSPGNIGCARRRRHRSTPNHSKHPRIASFSLTEVARKGYLCVNNLLPRHMQQCDR